MWPMVPALAFPSAAAEIPMPNEQVDFDAVVVGGGFAGLGGKPAR